MWTSSHTALISARLPEQEVSARGSTAARATTAKERLGEERVWDTGDARFQNCAVLLGACTTDPVGPRSGKDTARGGGADSKEHGDEEEETKDPQDQQATDRPQERVAATVSVTTAVVTMIVVVAVTTVVVMVVPTSVPAVPASAWKRGHDRPRRRTGAGRTPGPGGGGVGPTTGGPTDARGTATSGRSDPGGTAERLAATASRSATERLATTAP